MQNLYMRSAVIAVLLSFIYYIILHIFLTATCFVAEITYLCSIKHPAA